MQVKLLKEFRCVPDGEVYPKTYAAGDVVGGGVAEAAFAANAGRKVTETAPAAPEPAAAPARKALKAAPENK